MVFSQAESMVAGGPGRVGTLGRVSGLVEVQVLLLHLLLLLLPQVRSTSSSAVGVCCCPDLSVMYWWRAEGKNGHSLLLGGELGGAEVGARAGAAAMRVWGALWEGADRVEVTVVGVEGELARTRLGEQAEDCMNKYGVRVRLCFSEGERGAGAGAGEAGAGGARLLADQLIEGRGTGQQAEGFYNMNLRIVNSEVYQLVDHTSKLAKHFFDL